MVSAMGCDVETEEVAFAFDPSPDAERWRACGLGWSHTQASEFTAVLDGWPVTVRRNDGFWSIAGDVEPMAVDTESGSMVVSALRTEWVFLGEGRNGDYDPNDPNDRPVLRFDVLVRSTETGEWVYAESASNSTNVVATDPPSVHLQVLMSVHRAVMSVFPNVRVRASEMAGVDEDGIVPFAFDEVGSAVVAPERAG